MYYYKTMSLAINIVMLILTPFFLYYLYDLAFTGRRTRSGSRLSTGENFSSSMQDTVNTIVNF